MRPALLGRHSLASRCFPRAASRAHSSSRERPAPAASAELQPYHQELCLPGAEGHLLAWRFPPLPRHPLHRLVDLRSLAHSPEYPAAASCAQEQARPRHRVALVAPGCKPPSARALRRRPAPPPARHARLPARLGRGREGPIARPAPLTRRAPHAITIFLIPPLAIASIRMRLL